MRTEKIKNGRRISTVLDGSRVFISSKPYGNRKSMDIMTFLGIDKSNPSGVIFKCDPLKVSITECENVDHFLKCIVENIKHIEVNNE